MTLEQALARIAELEAEKRDALAEQLAAMLAEKRADAAESRVRELEARLLDMQQERLSMLHEFAADETITPHQRAVLDACARATLTSGASGEPLLSRSGSADIARAELARRAAEVKL